MEAQLFGMLNLKPGRYTPNEIIDSHREVREQIMRTGGPDRQRRLDDALIACVMLQDPARQSELLNRIRRDAAVGAKRTARRHGAAATVDGTVKSVRKPMPSVGSRDTRYAGDRRRGARPVARRVGCGVAATEPADRERSGQDGPSERFADMVAAAVEDGILRMSARQNLLAAAASMGIEAFKANLVIAEVLHDMATGRRDLPSPTAEAAHGRYIPVTKPRYGLRIAVAVAAAAALDLVILAWLAG